MYMFANPKTALAAVRRAVKAGDPAKIVDVCDRAAATFDAHYWPDDWTLIQRAADDAMAKAAAIGDPLAPSYSRIY